MTDDGSEGDDDPIGRTTSPAFVRLAEALDDEVMVFDGAGRYRFVNHAAADAWDLDPEDFMGRTPRQLDLPDAACDLLDELMTSVHATGTDAQIEVDLPPVHPGTSGRVVRAHAVADTDTGDVLVILEDATDVARLDDALARDRAAARAATARQRATEASFRTLADLVPVGIVEAAIDGTDLFNNRRTEELHGRSFVDVNEHDRIAFVHPDDRDAVQALWGAAAAGQHPPPLRYRALRADGTTRWLEAQMIPVVAPDGEVIRIIETFVDADHAVAAETALTVDRDRAVEESEVKSRFIARISHELRTPLNGIIGLSSALLDDEVSPAHRSGLEAIRASGDRLLDVLSAILDLAELDAGRLTLTMRPMDPARTVADVVEAHRPDAEAKGLLLHLLLAVDRTDDRPVVGDADRLRQVVDHLVRNAVQYTSAGQIRVVLRVTDASTHAAMHLEVADTGVGIDPADRERIFDPFSSALAGEPHDRTRPGVGLAVCRGLVERMGGQLVVDDAPDGGTRFRCRVPLSYIEADATLDDSTTASTAATAPTATPAVGGAAVPSRASTGPSTAGDGADGDRPLLLLAEDDEINRTVACAILDRLGFTVDVAVDGDEAVHQAEATPYAALLLDGQMPGRTGLEVAHAVRTGDGPNRSAPILALTAAAMSGERERFLAASMDGFLAKPFTMVQLAEALSALGLPVRRPDAAAVAAVAPVLDEERVDELRAIVDGAGLPLFDELRALFDATTPDLRAGIAAALAADDLARAGRAAQELASSCAAIGAVRAAAAAERVVQACEAGDGARATRLLDELAGRLDEAAAALDD